ncbi:hypothetical protein [Arthrobacter sp. B2a2-09]|uniref:hypothetical protein n=1 Tax=Arthrobacter sp. B2a2-09 TaxID=2952822 RepID=UPI0022CD8DC2|nr:hypothetical protein [Arthrobacter sp. B2a2-09]
MEIRKVLRAWFGGAGLRTAAERAGVDRKTARRYVHAAQTAGLARTAGAAAVDDALIGAVVAAVRPVRANGHGQAWDPRAAHEEQIKAWVAGEKGARGLSLGEGRRPWSGMVSPLCFLPLRESALSNDPKSSGGKWGLSPLVRRSRGRGLEGMSRIPEAAAASIGSRRDEHPAYRRMVIPAAGGLDDDVFHGR